MAEPDATPAEKPAEKPAEANGETPAVVGDLSLETAAIPGILIGFILCIVTMPGDSQGLYTLFFVF